jgi:hypothetical protein
MTLKVDLPDVLARHPAEFAGLKAISAGNILILPPIASAADLKSCIAGREFDPGTSNREAALES